ncbi:glycosyltransferase family 4 protein [Luteibacter sp.]|jgi:glycosyltransferase involved in cell wall biosynthesis|uniref:glycosyltransferase family 4 protein n=1 Tax=Luteibacter sp. TaxID=1886636 RepID=UPI0039C93DBB
MVNFIGAPPALTVDDVLKSWSSLADIADIVTRGGTRVSVVQMAGFDAQVERAGVDYRFVDTGGTRNAGELGRRAASVVASLRADVIHVHGLAYARHAAAMARAYPSPPVVLQDHADGIPRGWRRLPWRYWYRVASGIAFTSPELAEPFLRRGLFRHDTRFFAIPESSSRFTPGDRAEARAATGLHGAPCVLSVGHLAPGKDPITMLDGVARAAERLPDIQLYCAFGTAPSMVDVQERIGRDARLAGRVHLLGNVPHARIEALMRAADVYVSASVAESSGYALLEAMACGTFPVVTDIPAARAITGDGRVGKLWRRGDATALADALAATFVKGSDRRAVREHFDRTLSFDALGARWADAYAQLIAAKVSP